MASALVSSSVGINFLARSVLAATQRQYSSKLSCLSLFLSISLNNVVALLNHLVRRSSCTSASCLSSELLPVALKSSKLISSSKLETTNSCVCFCTSPQLVCSIAAVQYKRNSSSPTLPSRYFCLSILTKIAACCCSLSPSNSLSSATSMNPFRSASSVMKILLFVRWERLLSFGNLLVLACIE